MDGRTSESNLRLEPLWMRGKKKQQTHFALLGSEAESWSVLLDHETADPSRALFPSPNHHDIHITPTTATDESLASVHDVVVAIPDSLGSE